MREIEAERKTLEVMVKMYCNDRHQNSNELCRECEELLDYACVRLDNCVLGEDKPVCAKCTIHCYQPSMRVKIRAVMKYSGPRMVFKHPILAFKHIIYKKGGKDL